MISGWTERPFHVFIASEPSIRLLRPLETRVDREPVTRPRADRDIGLNTVDPDDPISTIDDFVRDALATGATDLAAVTNVVLERLPNGSEYASVGRIAECVARQVLVDSDRERTWRGVGGQLEIENWSIRTEVRRT